MKGLLLALKVALAAGILLLVHDKFDYAQFGYVLTNPLLFALIPLCWAANQFLTTLRLHYLLKALDRPSRLADLLRASMASLFVGNLTPGVVGADLVKFYYIKKNDPALTAGELAFVLVFDRVLGLLSILALCAFFGTFIDPGGLGGGTDSTRLLTLSPLLLILATLAGALLLHFAALRTRKLKLPKLLSRLLEIHAKIFDAKNRKLLSLIALSSVGAVFVLLAGLALVGGALQAEQTGAPEHLLQLFLIPLVLFASMIPLTPMGIGIAQVSMAGAYAMFGLTPSVGVSVSTMSQLGLLLVSLAVGGPIFLAGRGQARQVRI